MSTAIQQQSLAQTLHAMQYSTGGMPDRARAVQFLDATLESIFPQMLGVTAPCSQDDVSCCIERAMGHFVAALEPMATHTRDELHALTERFFYAALPAVARLAWGDAQAIYKGDPAAQSVGEVVATYPGLQAITTQRMAHVLYNERVPVLPRLLTEVAHTRTGIDIHPGAKIGESFCIDHGTGIVIGETATLGRNVKLYQSVTLGALSVSKDKASKKRHPTIQDNVVVYANATILGGDTVVGHDSIIGGNAFITESVPPFTMVWHEGKSKQRSLLPDFSI